MINLDGLVAIKLLLVAHNHNLQVKFCLGISLVKTGGTIELKSNKMKGVREAKRN